MSKFARPLRNQLKSLITNAMIRRLTSTETQKYIEENLHITVTPKYIYGVTAQIKRDCSRELNLLQKDRDYYLKHAFFDRIAEYETEQHVLWEIIKKNNDNPDVQIKAVNSLYMITDRLKDAYRTLPQLMGLEIPINYQSTIVGNNSLGKNACNCCGGPLGAGGCRFCMPDGTPQDGVDENGNPIL